MGHRPSVTVTQQRGFNDKCFTEIKITSVQNIYLCFKHRRNFSVHHDCLLTVFKALSFRTVSVSQILMWNVCASSIPLYYQGWVTLFISNNPLDQKKSTILAEYFELEIKHWKYCNSYLFCLFKHRNTIHVEYLGFTVGQIRWPSQKQHWQKRV